MADFTHSSRSIVRVYRSPYGAPRVNSYDESTAASTAVIQTGQVVRFDATDGATHRIVRAGALTSTATDIVGVAAAGSTSDGSTTGLGSIGRKLSVWEAAPEIEFLFPTKLAIASTQINTGFTLAFDSTLGINHLAAASTSATVRVTGVIPSQVGDTGGFLIGRFFSSVVAPAVSGV